MAGGTGFEPVLAESESAVLPLDDPPFEIGDIGIKLDYTLPRKITMALLISVSSTEVACGLFVIQPFFALLRVNRELQIQLSVTGHVMSHHIATAHA